MTGNTRVAGKSVTFTDDGLFMGNLANQYLGWFHLEGTQRPSVRVVRESRILDSFGRVRDVYSPENSDVLYVIIDSDNAPLLRVTVDP